MFPANAFGLSERVILSAYKGLILHPKFQAEVKRQGGNHGNFCLKLQKLVFLKEKQTNHVSEDYQLSRFIDIILLLVFIVLCRC
jgi:hypothetical protein